MAIPFLKQSDGKPSASLTMAVVGFVIVSAWLVLSIFEELWGLKIRAFDGGEAMIFLSPLLALYFGRRYTSDKFTLEAPIAPAVEPSDSTP